MKERMQTTLRAAVRTKESLIRFIEKELYLTVYPQKHRKDEKPIKRTDIKEKKLWV
jgi:hypothetical protein